MDSFLKTGEGLARPLQRALRNNMWENCGVVRDEARLLKGLETLREIKAASSSVDVRPDAEGYQDLAIALDLRASISATEVTLRSALARQESRGAHSREDYPERDDDNWLKHTLAYLDGNDVRLDYKGVDTSIWEPKPRSY